MVGVLAGVLNRIDAARGVIVVGGTELRVPGDLRVEVAEGSGVTALYEERGGALWATKVRPALAFDRLRKAPARLDAGGPSPPDGREQRAV